MRSVRLPVLVVLTSGLLIMFQNSTYAETAPCATCVRIRVGHPIVARGPVHDEMDADVPMIQLDNGGFRAFSSNQIVYSIDSASLNLFSNTRIPVLSRGASGTPSECGHWLTSTVKSGTMMYGVFHEERLCNYPLGQTNKSMAIATSYDEGRTWTQPEQIIRSSLPPVPGHISGEGDCRSLAGTDGYVYLYCLRAGDFKTIVARAPAGHLEAGNWMKLYQGTWSQPGLDGLADAIDNAPGWAPCDFPLLGGTLLLGTDLSIGGLKMSISPDHHTFSPILDPLLHYQGNSFQRPAATDLYSKFNIVNPVDMSRALVDGSILSYVYLPPNKDFYSRYLVTHHVTLGLTATPQLATVGVELSNWTDTSGRTRSTNIPMVDAGTTGFTYSGNAGYLMTRAPLTVPSREIVECYAFVDGHADYIVTGAAGGCGRTAQIRSLGWTFTNAEPSTKPLFRCYNEQGHFHFVSNEPTCAGHRTEWSLGYVLE